MDEYMASHISTITVAACGYMPEWMDRSWNGYDLVILDQPDSISPKAVGDRTLLWNVDTIPWGDRLKQKQMKRTFKRGEDEIFDQLHVK